MLANHAGALDTLVEAAEELIEALAFTEFNPHVPNHPPSGRLSRLCEIRQEWHHTQGQPCMIAGIAPATQGKGYRTTAS